MLVIVADDLGYLDLGCFGSEIRTPHLDALAKDGLTLTRFYVAPTCSPTRAMLLSGADAHVAGMGTMAGGSDPLQTGQPGYEGFMTHRVVTVATLLRDAGYLTCMAGKWHLGGLEPLVPHRRGFARSYALLPGGASHFADAATLTEHDQPAPYLDDGRAVQPPADFFSSDFYTDRLLQNFDEARRHERPFFAYAAYTAPHWPLQVPEAELDRYAGVYDDGWDVLRARRFAAAQRLGLVADDAEPPPRVPFAPAWDSLSADQQRVEARKMELYAAMVENLDRNIGRLIDGLAASGQLDNTFILFLPDNGPEGNPIDRLGSNETWLPQRFDLSYENMGRPDSYVFCGPGWAQCGAAPFRWFKAFPTEGGVCVPAIVRHPSVAAAGERRSSPASVKDVVPTLLELAGLEHPGTEYEGRRVAPLEGRSMLPFLTGATPSVHGEGGFVMGWELFGRCAVLAGSHKLLRIGPPYGPGRWALFDVEGDPGETTDLFDDRPELSTRLLELWQRYVARNRVIIPVNDFGYADER
ncbi:MAG: arylsulfatase [Planctomycetota bacterium]